VTDVNPKDPKAVEEMQTLVRAIFPTAERYHMAIARKPQSPQSEIENFIARGAGPAGKDDKRLAAIIRFPPDLLRRVDAAAKARGVSRAACILMVASRALDSGEL
jgi:hypothetical protein